MNMDELLILADETISLTKEQVLQRTKKLGRIGVTVELGCYEDLGERKTPHSWSISTKEAHKMEALGFTHTIR